LIFITTCSTRFIKDNDEGRGWIVKTPFSTNGHNKRYANSVEDIIKKITMQYKTLKEVLPYTMVQATMVNKKEYKIVLFKGEARYISRAPGYTNGTAFSTKPELMDFAINALKEFASACPNALVDSIMRVDVFQTMTGKLVVNEFESLEADHHCNSGLDKIAVDDEVRLYYEMVLRSIIDPLHLRNANVGSTL
jgi:hypothetical protein